MPFTKILDLKTQINEMISTLQIYEEDFKDNKVLSIYLEKVIRQSLVAVQEKLRGLDDTPTKEDCHSFRQIIGGFRSQEYVAQILTVAEMTDLMQIEQNNAASELRLFLTNVGIFLDGLPSRLSSIQETLEQESGLTLTDLIHKKVLEFYQNNLDHYTQKKKNDVELVMSVLIKPYENNSALIVEINKIIDLLQSDYLREELKSVLERHAKKSFKDKYTEEAFDNDSKPIGDWDVKSKHSERFTENFGKKPGGDQLGSIAFKTIIPTKEKTKFDKYLRLWLIKKTNGLLNSLPEVSKATYVRTMYESEGKERFLTPSGDLASKMFERFMTFNDFFDSRDRNPADPIDLDRGLFCGKPLRGLSRVLNVVNKVTATDIHFDNIGIVDKGDYFECELIDFEHYGSSNPCPPWKENDPFKYFRTNYEDQLVILRKMLELEDKQNKIPLAIDFTSDDNLRSSLENINPWLWKEVLKAFDELKDPSQITKQIVAEWMIDSIRTKMTAFPVQRTQVLNYFAQHPLSLVRKSNDSTECYRDRIQAIQDADVPAKRGLAFNRL